MAKPSRQKLTPLSLDELIESAGHVDANSGLGQFLQGRVVPFRVPDASVRNETGAPVLGSPVSIKEASGSVIETGAPVSTLRHPESVDTPRTSDVTGAPVTSALLASNRIQVYGTSPRGQRKIQRAVTVQKGQTPGETLVLDALWSSREAQRISDDCRRLTIGKRTVAMRAGLTYNNTKVALAGLIVKLAIEEQGNWNHSDGTTYLVYSYREILRRRERAGMTHFIKTKGVVFVNPATGAPLGTGAPVPTINNETGAVETGETGALVSMQTGAPLSTATPYRHLLSSNSEETTSTAIAVAIFEVMHRSDDSAAQKILADCRAHTTDITEDEVAQLIRDHGPSIASNRSLDNPMGVLIRHIPRTACGESFRNWRARNRDLLEAQLRRNAELNATHRQQQEEWKRILEDPQTSADEKSWARRMLTPL